MGRFRGSSENTFKASKVTLGRFWVGFRKGVKNDWGMQRAFERHHEGLFEGDNALGHLGMAQCEGRHGVRGAV